MNTENYIEKLQLDLKTLCKNSEKLGFMNAQTTFLKLEKVVKEYILKSFPRNTIQNAYVQGVLDTFEGIEKELNKELEKM